MSEHSVVNKHPVELIEPDVSAMFKRTMKKADAMNRLLEPGEEFNLTHMSVAVSLKRIADSLDLIGWWIIFLAMSTPAFVLGAIGLVALIVVKS